MQGKAYPSPDIRVVQQCTFYLCLYPYIQNTKANTIYDHTDIGMQVKAIRYI